ncbi:MAG: redox-sensing transcriptional repressor Rex [Chloroflexota bacterium]
MTLMIPEHPPIIPDIVIGRLPLYLRALNHMIQEGKRTTSSRELGKRLGISSAQIRKDLSHFGEFGKQGTGYHLQHLVKELQFILKLDRVWPVAVIGAGFLGHALASYNGFEERGFRISWIFDNSPDQIGNKINHIPIQSMSELEETIERENARIAILAVPAIHAQAVTDRLVAAGIQSILNYAPINLDVPAHINIGYSDPVIQLQHMTYYIDKEIQPEENE